MIIEPQRSFPLPEKVRASAFVNEDVMVFFVSHLAILHKKIN